MFCKNCGTRLDDDCNFCPECGTEIVNLASKTTADDDDYYAQNQAQINGASYYDEEDEQDNYYSNERETNNEDYYSDINYAMPSSSQNNNNKNRKSKAAAGVLGIFFGCFGVHNFYLGYSQKAVIQLVLGLLGCCSGFTILVSWLWGLIEGIMILAGKINTDGNGTPLSD